MQELRDLRAATAKPKGVGAMPEFDEAVRRRLFFYFVFSSLFFHQCIFIATLQNRCNFFYVSPYVRFSTDYVRVLFFAELASPNLESFLSLQSSKEEPRPRRRKRSRTKRTRAGCSSRSSGTSKSKGQVEEIEEPGEGGRAVLNGSVGHDFMF